MEIFKHIAPLKAYLKANKQENRTVGLVPTMGALHAGHLSLIKASKATNSLTVATIFVNPTQFNNKGDLLKYPRTIDTDTQKLAEVQCDVVFCPGEEEMYPEPSTIKLDFGPLDQVMEGHFRPGHFSGVGLVVSKLFNIVEPDNAYFGQKDWQQFAVISALNKQLNFNCRVHSVPTLREADGLAMSSRNLRLSASQREAATVFYQALKLGEKLLRGGTSVADVKVSVRQLIESGDDVRLEYFEVADAENLNLLENISWSKRPIMCIAGYVGDVRLIDNMFLQ